MADAPKKRLPFKATALHKTQTSKPPQDEDDDLKLFNRQEKIIPIIEAEQERRRKKKDAAKRMTTPRKNPTIPEDITKRSRDGVELDAELDAELDTELDGGFQYVIHYWLREAF